MKTYETFVDTLRDELEHMFGFEVESGRVEKLNGSYYGITFETSNPNVKGSIDLSPYYNEYNNGEKMFEDILFEIKEKLLNNYDFPDTDINIGGYNGIREKLMIQVVNTAHNSKMLAKVPHTDWNDLSLVYRVMIDGDKTMSYLFTNDMMDHYGLSRQQLHKDALENSPKAFPAMLKGISEVSNPIIEETGAESNSEPFYVATNNTMVYGAGCMFYPGFLKKIAKDFGSDFFILPSSIHELLLLPDKYIVVNGRSAEDLADMVREINSDFVLPNEVLSNSVYYYSSEKDLIEKVA